MGSSWKSWGTILSFVGYQGAYDTSPCPARSLRLEKYVRYPSLRNEFGRSTMRCYVCCLGGSSLRPRPRSASQSPGASPYLMKRPALAPTLAAHITSLRCTRTADHTCRLPAQEEDGLQHPHTPQVSGGRIHMYSWGRWRAPRFLRSF